MEIFSVEYWRELEIWVGVVRVIESGADRYDFRPLY